ncbi:MAG: helix-turn-helix transcriptional regulator [Clostridia bacterium]|nr:helix-turn-helix transcriptional regulator [Clostridia bacterium]
MMLNNNLKIIRMREYLMNKREFSKMLDIAEQQYSRYENGQSIPSLEIAIKISNSLQKNINDIWFIID